MKSRLAILAAALLIGPIATPAMAAECGSVTITEMNWSSAAIVTAVSSFLMEQGYGCKVQKVPTSTVPALTSLSETGKPDILTEVWPAVADVYYTLEKQGKIVSLANVIADGGQDGWWVPKYLVDQHPELKTLDGILAHPELVGGQFDNGPPGWGSTVSNNNLIKAFELEKHGIKVVSFGSGETLAASLAAAYKDKKPWFGYYWAPTALLGKYPMVSVDMGPVVPAIAKCNARLDCPTPGKTGWPRAPVLTTMSKPFRDAHPDIAALMSRVSFSNTLMSQLLSWQETNKATADETAAYFLTHYKDQWKSWVSPAALTKVSSVIK
ncbi:glycine betaine ABC transporter substrate-binding protein [Burkholderia cenocepacia]|uniref:glycine betaine ABC transporter substrate-binding protein n=1 Tax=Burkholderia cenocepacia TaxID=95486 RepID=UPI00158A47B7|nr:glycine betaine ABC transporter substrate-binding protein [Burkholderia cenocepacia]MCA7922465.1 glycine/betaine ABC transporter substrate-binding protein [Burkholderia cenocepacia]